MSETTRTPRRERTGRAVYVAVLILTCVAGVGTGAVLMRLGLWAPDGLASGLPNVLGPLVGPTVSPTPTVPPTLTPSPTPPPTATRTPTPIPPARIALGDQALYDGDWNGAAAEYQAVLDQSDDEALRAAALLGLGKARLFDGDAAGAIGDFTTYLDTHASTPHVAEAYFLLGEAHTATGQWAEAISAYQEYLDHRPATLEAYVQAAIAQAALQIPDYPAAIAALQAAVGAPRSGSVLDLREQLAGAYQASGDHDAALAEYDAVFAETDQNWRKARVEVLAGQLLYNLGRTDEAYERFQHAVNNYPEAASTFDALLILVNDGMPVDELQRGLTNYYAGNHEPAVAALLRYRELRAANDPSTSAAGDSTALYHLGLAYAALGQDAQAIAAWRELVANYPGDTYWTDAYRQIAFLQPYPDDVETFEAFAADAPEAPEAPEGLFRAARLHERNGDLASAAALWLRIAQEWPEAPEAADAAIQSGLVLYRSGDYAAAAQRFELAATLGTDTSQHARAWLWQGKAREKLGDRTGARAAYQRAAAFGPHGYYPLRAAQILAGDDPFQPPLRYDFDYDHGAEQAEVDRWLRATFPIAQGVDHPSDLQPGVWQDARFVRAAELWRLGRLQDAHAEFDDLRVGLSGDPLASWQLALYFHELGAYDLSIRAARSVVDLAGLADTLQAPTLIMRLRYPAPFAERVIAAGSEYGVHPFIMYSKMRIESFFWKYAYSVADARGLNQIIPPTADDIAAQLALEGFTYEDLFRPAVSIPMGAYYLSYIDGLTEGGPEALLAGYYAGPGNAQIWLEMAAGDPDLFVEVIRLPDAKGYVQTTFEYFEEYRELYGE